MSNSILVTDGGDGGARSTLATVRALAAAGYRPLVTVSGPRSLAAASRDCHQAIEVPEADDPAFADSIRDAVRQHGAAATIVASDAALLALGAPVEDFVDKSKLARLAADAGIPTPDTERVENDEELRRRADEFPYPIVLKPVISRFSTVRIAGPEALQAVRLQSPVVVQPYLDGPMSSVAGVMRGGRLVAVVHQEYIRTWPVECGTSCAAISTDGDPGIEAKLTELFADYEGIFQVQFRDGHLLDVNPRVYGSLPLAVAAGANLAALHVDFLLGRPAPAEIVRGRAGARYRWLDGDLRHIASLARHGRFVSVLGALWPRPGTVHSIATWRDPWPLLVRLRRMAGKLR